MTPRTPTGFCLAGLCSAAFACVMAWIVASPAPFGVEGMVGVRAAAALLAVLAAVATEALWGARPWAYRASSTLAGTWFAAVATLAFAGEGMAGLTASFWLLVPSAMVVVPIVNYVREACDDLFGKPRPRPVMTAAYRGRWIRQP